MINLAKYDYYLLHDIDLPIVYFCSRYYDFEVNPRLRYKHVFSYNKMRYNWQKAASYCCSWLVILYYVILWRPKVVHIQWFRIPRFDLAVVRILQRVFGVKVVFTAHNVLPHQGNESKCEVIFRKAYRVFDRIIVHSQATKKEIMELSQVQAERVVVIRHGILPLQVSNDRYEACKEVYDHKYAALEGKTVFTTLGYQNTYKGTDLLARVWANTPQLWNSGDCMLLIIGKVNDTSIDLTVLEGIANVILDNRRIPDEEFLYLLRHTDVYLLPYREISQSGAMLTVLTEHVPLLLADVGALAEPLDIAPIGWKIPRADEQDLQEALLYLVSHKKEVEAVRNNRQAWEKVCKFYDWKEIGQQTWRLYENLL